MGKFPFIVEYIAFAKRAGKLSSNSNKNGKIPIKMGKFLKIWESSHLLLNTTSLTRGQAFFKFP
jgi:hypothetical protein